MPSKQGQRRKARLEQLQADLTAAQGVVARERTKMEQLGEERQATAERATNLKKLDELKLLQVGERTVYWYSLVSSTPPCIRQPKAALLLRTQRKESTDPNRYTA